MVVCRVRVDLELSPVWGGSTDEHITRQTRATRWAALCILHIRLLIRYYTYLLRNHLLTRTFERWALAVTVPARLVPNSPASHISADERRRWPLRRRDVLPPSHAVPPSRPVFYEPPPLPAHIVSSAFIRRRGGRGRDVLCRACRAPAATPHPIKPASIH